MTGNSEHGSDTGTMDISEHLKTWNWFLGFMKWLVVGAVALLVFLAIFRTHG